MNEIRITDAVAMISVIIIACALGISSFNQPTTAGRTIPTFYLKNAITRLTSANVVNAIVWEFRGYDTLGEEMVLISASLSVVGVILSRERKRFHNSKVHEGEE